MNLEQILETVKSLTPAELEALELEVARTREEAEARLITKAEQLEEGALDEWIHEVFSARAADINNGGPELQIPELIEAMGGIGALDRELDRILTLEDAA